MKRKLIVFFAAACVLVITIPASAVMTSADYGINSSVISGGGGNMSASGLSILNVVGQPTPIISQSDSPVSANFTLYPGFIYTIKASTCFGDFNVDGDVDGSDLHIFLIGYPGSFDTDDLTQFAHEFGKTNCDQEE